MSKPMEMQMEKSWEWMPRRVNGCIGFVWLFESGVATREVQDQVVVRCASRWASETSHRACVIVSGSRGHLDECLEGVGVDVVEWEWLGRDEQLHGGVSKEVVGDVVQLSGLRFQYGATWISLGLLGGEVSRSVGGLCDGIVILVPRGGGDVNEKGVLGNRLREFVMGGVGKGSRGGVLGYMDVDLRYGG